VTLRWNTVEGRHMRRQGDTRVHRPRCQADCPVPHQLVEVRAVHPVDRIRSQAVHDHQDDGHAPPGGLLIAFNNRPLLLGGTRWIVILAHFELVLAFAFSAVSAALDRVNPAYRQAAESLGAGPVRVLFGVTLPLLLPALGAAAGLAIALSMGELGATVMVYPATWKTLPVNIFGLTDRGKAFQAAAITTVLPLVTLLALVALGRIRGRAAVR